MRCMRENMDTEGYCPKIAKDKSNATNFIISYCRQLANDIRFLAFFFIFKKKKTAATTTKMPPINELIWKGLPTTDIQSVEHLLFNYEIRGFMNN